MKRVLLVVTRAGLGGAQRSVLELSCQLRRRGHAVTVAAGEEGWLLEEVREEGGATHRFSRLKRATNPLHAATFAAELYQYVRKGQGNPRELVIHLNSSNTLPGALAAKIAGARTVFTARGLSMLDEGYEISSLLRALYRFWFWFWFWFVDGVVAVSTGNAERLRALGVLHGPVTVIPNGLDGDSLAFLDRAEARERIGARDAELAVVHLGRLEYAKRQEVLVEAWPAILAAVPQARLILIGDGPDETRLRELVRERGLEDAVRFAGPYPRAHEVLTGADVVVLPSRYEGWPVVLLEALIAGCAIAASDVGGVREQVGDAGVIVPASSDADAWAEALIALLKDPERREKLGAAARERSRLWTAQRMIGRYEELYRG